MMKLYEITFSPTGGTKKVADMIVDRFRWESSFIDLTDRCPLQIFQPMHSTKKACASWQFRLMGEGFPPL